MSDSKESNEKILEAARKRFEMSEEAESELRLKALDDIKFRAGQQWDKDVEVTRKRAGRPIFTVNRMPQFIRQITNDQRQNRPAIKVKPVDEKADVETAKVLQGLIRHIEANSNADAAYDTGFQHAVEGGFGFVRLTTDYARHDSFDQDILIKRVPNQFSCRLDPTYTEPDGSDANWGFCYEDMTKEEYEGQYGDSELAGEGDWAGVGAQYADWVKKDGVRVAEYFYKEFKPITLVELDDGKVMNKKDVPEDAYQFIKKERKSSEVVVHWVKINGYEIIEKTVWPGSWIPIIPILGDEIMVEGKRVLEGAIRHSKDSQKLHNYFISSEAEAIALAPKAPYVGPKGAFKGFEKKWATANSENHAFLEYNPTTNEGKPLAPPQRNFGEPNVQAITAARIQSADDIKATTGIYDAALGQKSNETSGVAIQRRNMQAQTANFHFVDNLSRSIKHIGKQIVELIPIVYDTERAVRIIGEDQEDKVMVIQQVVDPESGQLMSPFAIGKYDVAVDVGPSFATKRQEATESILDFMRIYPDAAPLIGDLLAGNMDWPGATEISERLKKMLPPELRDAEGEGQVDPQMQGKLEEMGQMVEALSKQLQESQDKLDSKMDDLESRERIQLLKMESDLKKELLKQDAADSRVLLEKQMQEIDANQQRLEMNSASREQTTASEQSAQMQQPTGGPPPGFNT